MKNWSSNIFVLRVKRGYIYNVFFCLGLKVGNHDAFYSWDQVMFYDNNLKGTKGFNFVCLRNEDDVQYWMHNSVHWTQCWMNEGTLVTLFKDILK